VAGAEPVTRALFINPLANIGLDILYRGPIIPLGPALWDTIDLENVTTGVIMSDETLRLQLYDSYKNRAMIYHLIYEELQAAVGAERAEEIMGRAIYRRGADKGLENYAQYGPVNLLALQKVFLGGLPDDGRMFQPELIRGDADALDIKFHACPLRDAWQEAGLPEEQVALLCRIASRVDYGMFEAAGFDFHADTYQPNGEGCCCLHIRPGKAEK
jgi:hypothetical protein